MLFPWSKRGTLTASERSDAAEPPEAYRVDFEKMLKGSLVQRRGKTIRQFGITMDGSTRLITSGDLVDRETYEALVAAGVLAGTPRDTHKRSSHQESRSDAEDH